MEELIIKDSDELKEIVAGFLRRLVSKKTKTISPKKRKDLIKKSAERYEERLKREGKIAPGAKIIIITEEEPLAPKEKKSRGPIFEGVMQNPSVVDAYISYLKREDHIETFISKFVELTMDDIDLIPEEKEKGKKALGELIAMIFRGILSLKADLRADMRDGHIALINKAIEYARKKNISPKEVFESDKHFKRFKRIWGVKSF